MNKKVRFDSEYKNISISELAALSNSADADVRTAVAKNKNTPKHILEKLKKDPDLGI